MIFDSAELDAASKRKGLLGDGVRADLCSPVGEPETVVSRTLCPEGQREILSFARIFVCLESAE